MLTRGTKVVLCVFVVFIDVTLVMVVLIVGPIFLVVHNLNATTVHIGEGQPLAQFVLHRIWLPELRTFEPSLDPIIHPQLSKLQAQKEAKKLKKGEIAEETGDQEFGPPSNS